MLTEESVGRLFMAGVIPGILLTALFVLTIIVLTRFNPKLGPAAPKRDMPERWRALGGACRI